jgi:hypothetical protein
LKDRNIFILSRVVFPVGGTLGRKGNAIVLALIMVLVAATSGCINAYWTKDAINPDQGEIVYKTSEKIVMKHYFDTVIGDGSTTENHTTNITTIKDGTLWIKVNIEITLDDISSFPLPIPEIPFDVERYVTLIITTPGGLTWFEKMYNFTSEDHLEILSPMEGDWVFQVNAVGYGTGLIPYHDGYEIYVNVNEPVVKK